MSTIAPALYSSLVGDASASRKYSGTEHLLDCGLACSMARVYAELCVQRSEVAINDRGEFDRSINDHSKMSPFSAEMDLIAGSESLSFSCSAFDCTNRIVITLIP